MSRILVIFVELMCLCLDPVRVKWACRKVLYLLRNPSLCVWNLFIIYVNFVWLSDIALMRAHLWKERLASQKVVLQVLKLGAIDDGVCVCVCVKVNFTALPKHSKISRQNMSIAKTSHGYIFEFVTRSWTDFITFILVCFKTWLTNRAITTQLPWSIEQ